MNGDKPIILVVDDAADNIQLLSGLLKNEYKVKASTSGEKAIAIANKSPQPSLILLDVIMPHMDGYQVCEALKKDDNTKQIPVVFVSGKIMQEDVNKGMALGAVGYLQKPVQLAELEKIIEPILA